MRTTTFVYMLFVCIASFKLLVIVIYMLFVILLFVCIAMSVYMSFACLYCFVQLAEGCEGFISWHQQPRMQWVFIKGGCSGRGVQWMGVVLDNKLVCNII